MNRRYWIPLLLVGVWLASSLYIVRGNEQAVVRRFGRFVTNRSGEPKLVRSGLHVDLPWPLARADRLNLSESHTVTVGRAELGADELNGLLEARSPFESRFITADKNVMNAQATAHFRIAPDHVREYLTAPQRPERQLAVLLEAAVTEAFACSRVDDIHPLGLTELQPRLTQAVRNDARRARLGLEIDLVQIDNIYPPLRVKADFQDVVSARADRERLVESAEAWEDTRIAQAQAAARETRDAAAVLALQLTESATSRAASFERLLGEVNRDQSETPGNSRQLTMQRLYVAAMQEVLSEVASKVFLESGKPVDLTIFRRGDE